jgi:hypothetical protein
MAKLTEEQLRFFMHEVLGLFDYGDEDADTDPLEFVRERLKEERKQYKQTRDKLNDLRLKVLGVPER